MKKKSRLCDQEGDIYSGGDYFLIKYHMAILKPFFLFFLFVFHLEAQRWVCDLSERYSAVLFDASFPSG